MGASLQFSLSSAWWQGRKRCGTQADTEVAASNRKRLWAWKGIFETSKLSPPPPGARCFQQGFFLILSNSAAPLCPRIQICEPLGGVLIQTTTRAPPLLRPPCCLVSAYFCQQEALAEPGKSEEGKAASFLGSTEWELSRNRGYQRPALNGEAGGRGNWSRVVSSNSFVQEYTAAVSPEVYSSRLNPCPTPARGDAAAGKMDVLQQRNKSPRWDFMLGTPLLRMPREG